MGMVVSEIKARVAEVNKLSEQLRELEATIGFPYEMTLQQSSSGSFLIVLPKPFCDSKEYKKGQKIVCRVIDGALVIL